MVLMEEKLKNIILKHDILNKAGIENKFLGAFVDSMHLDLKFTGHNVRTIPFMNSSYVLKCLIILLGVIYSNILYLIYVRNKSKIDYSKVKYIFLPFYDSNFIRFKHIPEIIQNDYAIIYPPGYHIKGVKKHLIFFRNRNISVLTPNFGFSCALIYFYQSIKCFNKIRIISNEIQDEISVSAKNSFQLGFYATLLNGIFMKNLLDTELRNHKTKLIWFYDFDKDYKYIAYNSVIKHKRVDDVSVHIQHGLFWGNNLCYTNPNSDYVFCCSEREKRIISTFTPEYKRVLVTGAPLQTFENHCDKSKETNVIRYDFLILLSSSLDTSFELQCEILTYLKNKTKFSYAVRFRPMSKYIDQHKFSPFLDNGCITHNNTLSEDIEKAAAVISFSEDSLIECFRKGKPTMFGNVLDLKFIDDNKISVMPFNVFKNILEFESIFNKFKIDTKFDFSKDIYIKDNFGEINFERMKYNFLKNIEEIQ